jgi:enoyl-CoA hydratase
MLHGMQKVRGSNPLSSTDLSDFGLPEVKRGLASGGARALAARIAANGQLAVAAAKQIVAQLHDWDMAAAWTLQEPITRPVFGSEDAREGARLCGKTGPGLDRPLTAAVPTTKPPRANWS